MNRTVEQIEEEQRRLAETAAWAAQQQQIQEDLARITASPEQEPSEATESDDLFSEDSFQSWKAGKPNGAAASPETPITMTAPSPTPLPAPDDTSTHTSEKDIERVVDLLDYGKTDLEIRATLNIDANFDDLIEAAYKKLAERIVKQWVAEDEEVELSERRTYEDMVGELREIARCRGSYFPTSWFAEIVSAFAPNAPHKTEIPFYPIELTPLVQSGVAVYEGGYWLVPRCEKCGQFKRECCGRVSLVPAVRPGEQTLTPRGRQAVGLDPIEPPKPPKSREQIDEEAKERLKNAPWWHMFRGAGELEGDGTVKMHIENFVPEGITLLCGLPKEGKSWVAMSIAKALTSGRPLFERPEYKVPEIIPVLYLAAESGDGALKLRCEKFGITKDKTRFIARTLTQGPMFGLEDSTIESAVRALRHVVILETLIRFNESNDEDDASENRKLAQALFRLIALGARAVICVHHSRKDVKSNPTKEAAVRGSGDTLAMTDAVWLVLQDERLFRGGKGPNEIDVIGWGRDFNPAPMRLALTEKAPEDLPAGVITFAPGLVSCIDRDGDLKWVDKKAVQEAKEAADENLAYNLEALVQGDPTLTLKELAKAAKTTAWAAGSILKGRGWSKVSGKSKKGKPNLWRKGS